MGSVCVWPEHIQTQNDFYIYIYREDYVRSALIQFFTIYKVHYTRQTMSNDNV